MDSPNDSNWNFREWEDRLDYLENQPDVPDLPVDPCEYRKGMEDPIPSPRKPR